MGSFKRVLQTGLVSVGAVYFFSCANVQNLPSAPSVSAGAGCPTGIGGMDASCCDATGTIINPPPNANCSVVVPGVPGVTNPMNSGATAGSAVTQNTGAASKLVGGQRAGGGIANESAATAGAQAPPSTTSLSATGSPLGSSGLGITASGNASSTGQVGVGGASGSVATAPSASDSPNPSASSGATDNNSAAGGAQFAGGGGTGLLPNGAHPTGFQYGNGLASGGASGAAGSPEIGFGAERNPATMATEDPSDYFTRIGLDDSLFKKVEKRYRTKSVGWEMAAVSASTIKVIAPK